jgi:flagellar biosynthesis protein FlhF
MTTDVRTFTAASMQQALDIVRQEMGPDAVILHTRQIEKRRLWPWLKSRQQVEITAGAGVNVRPVLPQAQSPSTGSAAISALPRRFLNADELAPPPPLLKTDSKSSAPAKGTAQPPRSTPPAAAATPRSLARGPVPARPETLTPRTSVKPSFPSTPQTTTKQAVVSQPTNDPTAEIHKRLDALQQALAELTRQAKVRVADEVPVELFPYYARLIDADVDEPLARELTIHLKREATADQLASPAACTALLTAMVEREIRCTPPIKAVRGRRKVAALIGPTGVGKTTTIAKLAANFRLKDGWKLGLVTVDTYRVAAVEQLRTYAEIIDLPMKVVTNPAEMHRALDELSGLDLVLVDTAGRSPNDDLQLQELKSLLQTTGIDEVHLVLSLAAGAKMLEATAAKFSPIKMTSVILTKLDETATRGTLLTLARQLPWPFSYVTNGQSVPDDIEPAHSARLANWMLENKTR